MDTAAFVEVVKIGGPVLGFAIVLLWVTLRDKDAMRAELRELNQKLIEIIGHNTEAMRSLKDTMDQRPCLRD